MKNFSLMFSLSNPLSAIRKTIYQNSFSSYKKYLHGVGTTFTQTHVIRPFETHRIIILRTLSGRSLSPVAEQTHVLALHHNIVIPLGKSRAAH
jgi:hypothetical protein